MTINFSFKTKTYIVINDSQNLIIKQPNTNKINQYIYIYLYSINNNSKSFLLIYY